ncbi:hypothetical protein PR202_gb11184 [Eleusine coracana subsp. coracana]|uniref:Uncharacterized protein n=1 Tax=Eleusine coracana subsp. coracana TaxID=191504 RepID=A0AAV5EME7_ELECO|nr:hypothetical protein PR202_gb11184 [Eleusine coracana subsp. coracana]
MEQGDLHAVADDGANFPSSSLLHIRVRAGRFDGEARALAGSGAGPNIEAGWFRRSLVGGSEPALGGGDATIARTSLKR